MPSIPSAQYLRMSTEDQPNSIPLQREAIQRYACTHGFEVVATYADPGKSGLEIRNRPGLRCLLRDVLTGDCLFRAVLVYDVSRWGRFQDTDESAHYEFLCRRAGIPVIFCAEQFENDNTLPNAIMKTLKRTMAAEYSRELSIKIAAAQRRMSAEGFHVGGAAAYGLRRMLISADGRKQILNKGQWKNLTSDRVVLVAGPKKEVECVRTIFDLAADKKNCPHFIAQELNRRKLRFSCNQPWDREHVYRILKNEKYLGCNVWGMTDTRFKHCPQRIPRSEWIVKREVFPPLITTEQFNVAKKQIRGRFTRGKTQADYLGQLTKALPKETDSMWVLKRKLDRRRALGHHLGNILNAYELIGYRAPSRTINSTVAHYKIYNLKKALFEQLKMLFPLRVRMVHRSGERRFRVLDLDGRWRVAVYVCQNVTPRVSRQPRWLLRTRRNESQLPGLICIPDSELKSLQRFYFVSDLAMQERKYKIMAPNHPWLAAQNRLDSLADLVQVVTRAMQGHKQQQIPTEKVSVVGNVAFTDADSTIVVDGREILLSRVNAAIFRLLLRNAERVVPRAVLSQFPTTRDRKIYLTQHITQLRESLGPKLRQRIVTVRHEGYMYQAAPKRTSFDDFDEFRGGP